MNTYAMYHKADTEDLRVPEGQECPTCGISLADDLEWTDHNTVICAGCGTEYTPEAVPPRGIKAQEAAYEALDKMERWGEAALVHYDDGSFDAVPAAYLTDVSWSGKGHVDGYVIVYDLVGLSCDERNWGALFEMERQWAARRLVERCLRSAIH